MPKRKITLDEAFAAIEQHGLQVQVVGTSVSDEQDVPTIDDFIEAPPQPTLPQKVGRTTIKVTLYAKHSVGTGTDSAVYGPGVVYVPADLADHLLYQDMIARRADERAFDHKLRSFVVVQRGNKSIGQLRSLDHGFDMSSALARLGEDDTTVL